MIVKEVVEQSFGDYHWKFKPDTEDFTRWGKEEKDDPEFSPVGPEHLDIEVSTICHGVKGTMCSHCFTNNSPDGNNMSIETFEALFDLVKGNLSTIHLNIGDLEANPDLGKMLRYAVASDVVPSVTLSGERRNDAVLYDLVTYCGHIDVSLIDQDTCFNTIARLQEIGKSRVNLRLLLSSETYAKCNIALYSLRSDVRLRGLNGVKIDWLRPQNRSKGIQPITEPQLRMFLNMLASKRIPFAVSQCIAGKVSGLINSTFCDMKPYVMECEPCEAGLFTGYINVNGVFYPCPFMEFAGVEGTSVLDKSDFVKDVWNNPDNTEWRDQLLCVKRTCPIFI